MLASLRKGLFLFILIGFSLNLPAQVSKTVNCTGGALSVLLTSEEKNTVTDLTITGTIDARDFKTMRDSMGVLDTLDLSSVTIATYIGTEGTYPTWFGSYSYMENTIPDCAFYSLEYPWYRKPTLTTFIFPYSVKSIGSYSFSGCLGFKSIIIPSWITSIGSASFAGCTASITVDESNHFYSSMDGILFNKTHTELVQCTDFKTTYTVPSSVISIGNCAFVDCYKLTEIIIPPSVKSIAYGAFVNCTGLQTLIIPSSVTFIDNQAFERCSGLKSVTISSSITSISAGVFTDCSGLTEVTIPSSVTSIGFAAFKGCTGLTSATIPPSVTSIKDEAFSNCIGLNSIFIYSLDPWSILSNIPGRENVFYNVNKSTCTLYVPYGSKNYYQIARQWKDFTNIIETPGFFLSTYSLEMPASAANTIINFNTSTEWIAYSDQPWLTIGPESWSCTPEDCINYGSITFTATENPLNSSRMATVTFLATEYPAQTVNIKQESLIPDYLEIIDTIIPKDLTTCFNALNTMTVAGSDTVVFESGSSVDLIAGNSILLLPGFHAYEGCFAHAYITDDGTFCDGGSGSIVQNPDNEKSISIKRTDQKSVQKDVKVYPNPSKGKFTIEYLNINSGSEIKIYNALGAIIYHTVTTDDGSRKIDLPGIKKGFYFIRVIDGMEHYTRKVIVN
jgi:hypothetical protein